MSWLQRIHESFRLLHYFNNSETFKHWNSRNDMNDDDFYSFASQQSCVWLFYFRMKFSFLLFFFRVMSFVSCMSRRQAYRQIHFNDMLEENVLTQNQFVRFYFNLTFLSFNRVQPLNSCRTVFKWKNIDVHKNLTCISIQNQG